MGQKTHPIGLRLGINQLSQSHWYAKKADYVFFLKEDQYIRNYILQNYRDCFISTIEIERRRIGVRIRISSAQIDLLVGVDGKSLERLHNDLQRRCQNLRSDHARHFESWKINTKIDEKPSIQVFVREINQPEENATYLADLIVGELEIRTPFRQVLRMTQKRAQKLGKIQGLRVQISGRLNGVEIARTEGIRRGRVPLHTLSAKLDYSYKSANTIYGLLGVKVWTFHNI